MGKRMAAATKIQKQWHSQNKWKGFSSKYKKEQIVPLAFLGYLAAFLHSLFSSKIPVLGPWGNQWNFTLFFVDLGEQCILGGGNDKNALFWCFLGQHSNSPRELANVEGKMERGERKNERPRHLENGWMRWDIEKGKEKDFGYGKTCAVE